MAFPGREANLLLLGSDEGKVYKARVHDQAGVFESVQAHEGPLTAIDCHPASKEVQGAAQLADLYLTSSIDWTVKLWSSKLQRPLLKFDVSRDYVYDVKWCVAFCVCR
jgi:dynein intermediate chain